MDDEKEVLEAIFDSDFEVRVHPRDGSTIWRIQLPGFGAAVAFKLPKEGYPEREPPSLAVEFDEWPAGADAFTARMNEEARAIFMPGQTCVFAWVDHVRDALTDAPELTGGTVAAAAAAVAAAAGAGALEENTGPGVGVVPIATSAVETVQSSLLKAGFSSCGPGVYSHGKRGITVEISQELTITVDGIDAEDLSDWATMQLQEHAETFGEHLCVWVVAQREEGFSDEVAGEGEAAQGLDFLPSPAELGVDRNRELLIYTWGKALRKAAPPDSGCNFNAGILNGRGGGADLRTMNGLSDEVQNNVASCGLFPRWITMVCHKVEHSNLNCISINCTKGRHRSVAAAEILKKVFYPQATTKHLTIY